MAKKLTFALVVLLFSGGAWAGSCPSVMAEIDEALQDTSEVGAQLSDEVMAEVRNLREQGEEYHNAGDHGQSMDALNRAKELLGMDGSASH